MVWDTGEIDSERIWETGCGVSFQGERSSVENYRAPSLGEALALARSRTSWVMVPRRGTSGATTGPARAQLRATYQPCQRTGAGTAGAARTVHVLLLPRPGVNSRGVSAAAFWALGCTPQGAQLAAT